MGRDHRNNADALTGLRRLGFDVISAGGGRGVYALLVIQPQLWLLPRIASQMKVWQAKRR